MMSHIKNTISSRLSEKNTNIYKNKKTHYIQILPVYRENKYEYIQKNGSIPSDYILYLTGSNDTN